MRKPFPSRRVRRPALVLSDRAPATSLFAILAILTFLAGLVAAGGEIVAASTREWRAAIFEEATIQLRPRSGRDMEADLASAAALARGSPAVAEARVLSKGDAESLLAPWLGTGLDLGALSVPRLIVLRVAGENRTELRALGDRLRSEIPGASLDDHDGWRARLSRVATTLIGVAAALAFLVLGASGLAVAFATRGAMAGSRDAVDVLQLVGARDGFIVREFARRFLALGAAAAFAGAAGAAGAVPLLGVSISLAAGAGGDGSAFLPDLALGWRGYALIALVALADAAVAGLVSALTAKRFLRQLRSG